MSLPEVEKPVSECECCEVESRWYFNLKWKIKAIWHSVKYKIVKPPKSNLILHAERELIALGYDLNQAEEDPNKWICNNLFELLEVFSKQGHSGMSAPYCVRMFSKLAMYEPLCPLKGTDEEWFEYADGKYQNIRCSHVFKDKDGQAYDSEGKIFEDNNGTCWTNSDSRVLITFPYTPVREYINRPEDINENNHN